VAEGEEALEASVTECSGDGMPMSGERSELLGQAKRRHMQVSTLWLRIRRETCRFSLMSS
jgi:hypothetical protein